MTKGIQCCLVLALSASLTACLSDGNSDNKPTESTADTAAPVVSAFSLPTTANSLTVGVGTLTAADNIGVTGYMITTSNTPPLPSASGWSTTAPSSFTFPSNGSQTAYAWARDASGNVSASRSAQITITTASAADYSGTWTGSFSGMPLTYLITQNGTSLTVRSVPTLLTAEQTYTGTIGGSTSVISTTDYATATATLTAIDNNTVRVVQDSCSAIPANAIYCIVPVGTAITFTRS